MEKTNRNLLVLIGLGLLMLVEYSLFKTYFMREVVPFYPKSYDQASYLGQSYALYEGILEKGRILKKITHVSLLPQTLLFHIQAALAFLIFGASRLTALMINFIYFALLQIAGLFLFKQITGKFRYGLLFVGLLLTIKTLSSAGDFRIDFIALCLYGILCCAIIQSQIFLSRKWTGIVLGISALLVMMRYLTLCYIIGLGGLLFLYYLGKYLADKRNRETQARLKNIFIFGLGIIAISIPIIIINHEIIYNYYIVGHLTGAEKMMRLKVALRDSHLSNAIAYYPVNFYNSHLSTHIFGYLSAILVLYAFLIAASRKRQSIEASYFLKQMPVKDIFVFLFLSIFSPLFVLTMDDSKSPIVIGIIIAPVMLFVTFMYVYFSEKLWIKKPRFASRLLSVISIAFLIVGLYTVASHFDSEYGHTTFTDKDPVATQLTKDIGDYARAVGWKDINATSDYLADFINAPIAPYNYEIGNGLLNVQTLALGNNGMTAISKEQAISSLENAHVFTHNLTDYTPDPIFPFEASIHAVRPLLQKMADEKMVRLGEYLVLNNRLRVYVKPDAQITGTYNNWIASQGIWIEVPAIVAQQMKTLTLEGDSDFGWLHGQSLVAHMSVEVNGKDLPLNTLLNINSNHYRITTQLPEWKSDKTLMIHLTFSRDFFDRKISETQRLVAKSPSIKSFSK